MEAGNQDQNTEADSLNISQEISEAVKITQELSEAISDDNINRAENDIEMEDQSDAMDGLNLEIQTVESIQDPKASCKLYGN